MALQVKKKFPLPYSFDRSVQKLPQRTYRREQRQQTLHRTTSASIILLLIAIAAGGIYTWYMGQQKTAAASLAEPARTVRPVFKPPKIASDAQIGAAVQTVTPEAKPGENASISIRTNPEATCTIEVKYRQTLAADSGLSPKTADEFGIASWAWTIANGTPAGTWPIGVTCKNKKNSIFVASQITIK